GPAVELRTAGIILVHNHPFRRPGTQQTGH
ncbi:unnamed protein product, partial [marine sediment metagenome]